MKPLTTFAAAAAILLTGAYGAMAAPAAAPAWDSHFTLNSPAPAAQSTAIPFITLLNTPVSAGAPVRAPYCTCVFGTMPGQYGSSRDFPPGPPVQQPD